MKKIFFAFLLTTFLSIQLYSQLIQDQGAVSTSMAGLNVTENNLWSINNNVGNLATLESTQAGLSVNNRFLISDLISGTIAFAIPLNNKAIGINYSNFGNENYQYHTAGIGYSMTLGDHVSAGVKFNYHNINLGNFYGSSSIISGDIGISAELSDELKFGAAIKNPTLSKLADYEDERLPTLIQIGFDYLISEQLHTLIAIEKDIMYPASVKAALIYQPMKSIVLRGGVGTQPTTAAFGIGTSIKSLNIDLATQYHQVLGFSPEISINYCFK